METSHLHPNDRHIAVTKPRRIKLEELKDNRALHTRFKKEQRKLMLEGKRSKECDYCWRVEDATNEFSDRIYKSCEPGTTS